MQSCSRLGYHKYTWIATRRQSIRCDHDYKKIFFNWKSDHDNSKCFFWSERYDQDNTECSLFLIDCFCAAGSYLCFAKLKKMRKLKTYFIQSIIHNMVTDGLTMLRVIVLAAVNDYITWLEYPVILPQWIMWHGGHCGDCCSNNLSYCRVPSVRLRMEYPSKGACSLDRLRWFGWGFNLPAWCWPPG